MLGYEYMAGSGVERDEKKLDNDAIAKIEWAVRSVEDVMEQQHFKTGSLLSMTVRQYLMRHADAKRIELKMGERKIILTKDEDGYHVEDTPLSPEELESTKRWHRGFPGDPASWDPSGWVYGYSQIQFEHVE